MRGALPPVDLRAVCFVRAISSSRRVSSPRRLGLPCLGRNDEDEAAAGAGMRIVGEKGGAGGLYSRGRQRGTGGAGAAWAAGDAWTKAASCDRLESGSGCEPGSDGAGWAGENTRSVGGSRRGGDWWAAGEARIGDVAIEMGQRCQRPPGVGLRVSWAGLAWARPRNAHLVVVESVLNSV